MQAKLFDWTKPSLSNQAQASIIIMGTITLYLQSQRICCILINSSATLPQNEL